MVSSREFRPSHPRRKGRSLPESRVQVIALFPDSRTKHEVKAFIESAGGPREAEALLARAHTRRTLQEKHEATMKLSENRRQGIRR